MRIIKQGRKLEEKVVEATCRNCGTVIEAALGEMHFQSDQREGDFYYIHCPVCEHQINHYPKAGGR